MVLCWWTLTTSTRKARKIAKVMDHLLLFPTAHVQSLPEQFLLKSWQVSVMGERIWTCLASTSDGT